jgi:hypothetical protein
LENAIFPAGACLCSPVCRLVTVPYQTSDVLLWEKHQVGKTQFFVPIFPINPFIGLFIG